MIFMNLNKDVEKISKHLTKKQKGFDAVMDLSREIIREAGQMITMMHNDDWKSAVKILKKITKNANSLRKIDAHFKYYTLQAYQEYVEALVFFEIKTKERIPTMSQLGVEPEAYLLGLMDVEGELKREILESLRVSNIEKAEYYFDNMKKIYDGTRRLRFAEAVMSGFRRKQDTARIQIENAGSEILSFRNSRR